MRIHATPLFLCLVAVVFADLGFAIDSIPAAFAITRDAVHHLGGRTCSRCSVCGR